MLSQQLLMELKQFVDSHISISLCEACEPLTYSEAYPVQRAVPIEMEDFIKNNKKHGFCELLFKHIDQKEAVDSEIYKRAGVDRRLFSKLRSNRNYHPSKNTAIAFALALELNHKDAVKLIEAAGYALSDSETFDLVITFCLQRGIHDIMNINIALDHFGEKPLIGTCK